MEKWKTKTKLGIRTFSRIITLNYLSYKKLNMEK